MPWRRAGAIITHKHSAFARGGLRRIFSCMCPLVFLGFLHESLGQGLKGTFIASPRFLPRPRRSFFPWGPRRKERPRWLHIISPANKKKTKCSPKKGNNKRCPPHPRLHHLGFAQPFIWKKRGREMKGFLAQKEIWAGDQTRDQAGVLRCNPHLKAPLDCKMFTPPNTHHIPAPPILWPLGHVCPGLLWGAKVDKKCLFLNKREDVVGPSCSHKIFTTKI